MHVSGVAWLATFIFFAPPLMAQRAQVACSGVWSRWGKGEGVYELSVRQTDADRNTERGRKRQREGEIDRHRKSADRE